MERKQLFLKIKFAFFCWIQLNFSTLFSDGSFCSWIWHSNYSLQALLSFVFCLFWVNLKLCWRRKISNMTSAKTTLFSNNLETVILPHVDREKYRFWQITARKTYRTLSTVNIQFQKSPGRWAFLQVDTSAWSWRQEITNRINAIRVRKKNFLRIISGVDPLSQTINILTKTMLVSLIACQKQTSLQFYFSCMTTIIFSMESLLEKNTIASRKGRAWHFSSLSNLDFSWGQRFIFLIVLTFEKTFCLVTFHFLCRLFVFDKF